MHSLQKILLSGFVLSISTLSYAETAPVQSTVQEHTQTQTRQTPTAADFERLNNQNRSRTESGMGAGAGQHNRGNASSSHSGGSLGTGSQRRYGGGR
ncbi:MAG: hypothetical protein B7X12_08680 [Halothiobacillus sp. 20-53-49]|nr:hypothetical protein [Halothiobacillaceae bacterium]OYV45476.1 MAG: hypothetical protein B7X12_08680 [Halothiobacillus sp. 20-53-49]HUN00777.1 hypothetical protein [Halothiobacillus sp.]